MELANVRRDIRALVFAASATCLLGGCSWFHHRAEKQNDVYKTSVQERPLEVPPDLDKPNTSGAMAIPEAGSASAGTASSGGETAAPATAATGAAPATEAAAPATAVTLGGDGLHVADSVDSTWNRVGLALERSGAATILARDEGGRSFEVQTAGQVVSKPGLFKKIVTLGMAKGKKTVPVRLTLRVTAEGDGSKVSAEGATDEASREAAQALLATLKQRLS
jgi:uncharacterized lipoprotein